MHSLINFYFPAVEKTKSTVCYSDKSICCGMKIVKSHTETHVGIDFATDRWQEAYNFK